MHAPILAEQIFLSFQCSMKHDLFELVEEIEEEHHHNESA